MTHLYGISILVILYHIKANIMSRNFISFFVGDKLGLKLSLPSVKLLSLCWDRLTLLGPECIKVSRILTNLLVHWLLGDFLVLFSGILVATQNINIQSVRWNKWVILQARQFGPKLLLWLIQPIIQMDPGIEKSESSGTTQQFIFEPLIISFKNTIMRITVNLNLRGK